jgi:hypothetical protein
VVLLLGIVAAEVAPAPLECLARLYSARAVDGALVLQSGEKLPFDDGRAKTFEDKLARPDLKDMLAIPYPSGPIAPVTVENQDPGRIRVEALFAAQYPKKDLVEVPFLGRTIRVHRKVAGPIANVDKRLARWKKRDARFLLPLGGTVNDRKIAGTDRTSTHAYGIAIDLNPEAAYYWRWEKGGWKNRLPQEVVDAFEAEGFIWGGRWFHFDTMHFEYRPELFQCR